MTKLFVISGISGSGVTTMGHFVIPFLMVKKGKHVKTTLPKLIEISDLPEDITEFHKLIESNLLQTDVVLIGPNIPNYILPTVPKAHVHLKVADSHSDLLIYAQKQNISSDVLNVYIGALKNSSITHFIEVFTDYPKRHKLLSMVKMITLIFQTYKKKNYKHNLLNVKYANFIQTNRLEIPYMPLDKIPHVNTMIYLSSIDMSKHYKIINTRVFYDTCPIRIIIEISDTSCRCESCSKKVYEYIDLQKLNYEYGESIMEIHKVD